MYDLYIFDLDGTLINTEELHYQSYKEALKFYNYKEDYDFKLYCKLSHYDDNLMKIFVSEKLNVNYEKFYSLKKSIYLKKIEIELKLIDGVEDLILKLESKNIKMCIVSHSDKETIDFVLKKLPILQKIKVIFSRDDYLNRKPHPECYIKALTYFSECKNVIGFEDSYKGWESLNSTNITSVFVGNKDYYYFNKINPKNQIENFLNFKEELIIKKESNIDVWVDEKISNYQKSISKLKESFLIPIQNIISILNKTTTNIYLTGIGKCGHICKKSVSTWQSIGISCHYLNIPDLFHGDFGILKENDVIIYISNSGNTKELINCTSYVKEKFNVLQILLTINGNCEASKYVNISFQISQPINEIDKINMAPTVSSVIFMMFLDMLGIYIAESKNITIEKFQLNHPGGDLGKISKNIIDYVIIVASGSGSRLYPLTKYIPKILVTFKNKPFIEHLIEYWKKYTKNIIIVANSTYIDLIKFYTKKYKTVILKEFNELTGTADTINKSITNEYYHKNLLFTWCDILPDEDLSIEKLNKTTVLTFGNECRYKAFDNRIEKNKEGNIVGLYYINNYKGLTKYNIGEDICDVFIKNFGDFNIYEINKLIDIGDLDKFKKYCSNEFQTRFFNKITINGNNVIKESCNSQGNEIIKKEINWYKNIKNYDFLPLFTHLDDHKFQMSYIKAEPLYKKFKLMTLEEKNICLKEIYKNLELLHQNKPNEKYDSLEDIKIECYDKIINRIKQVEPILKYFEFIKKVDNNDIGNLQEILSYLKNMLIQNCKNYCVIHGDCQFSNILYNDKIYFIDPRGYFGNTLIYGDPDYDYAKVLYALSGYDEFNNDELFNVEINNDNININISNYLSQDLDIIISDRIKAWLIIIWFGLTQYNSNNVIKCISAYFYAFKLFKQFFE
jgi:HAD superfamily hydrolase (TIGR01509 family)